MSYSKGKVDKETDGIKQGEGRQIQPCRYSRVTVPSGFPAFPTLSCSHAISLYDPACSHTGGGRSFAGGCSSAWNLTICIWNGQVETVSTVRLC